LETANDPAATVGAELTFFAIHKMTVFVLTFRAVRRKEIFDTGSATGNCLTQHRLYRVIESDDRAPTQSIHFTVRMESGTKENFVRVNIPNPGNHLLMHQQWLQPTTPGSHEMDKFIARHREGIDPETTGAIGV
jgi:hypothetical protein